MVDLSSFVNEPQKISQGDEPEPNRGEPLVESLPENCHRDEWGGIYVNQEHPKLNTYGATKDYVVPPYKDMDLGEHTSSKEW
jgi:hypothetical protein